jgi:hypothetical protein
LQATAKFTRFTRVRSGLAVEIQWRNRTTEDTGMKQLQKRLVVSSDACLCSLMAAAASTQSTRKSAGRDARYPQRDINYIDAVSAQVFEGNRTIPSTWVPILSVDLTTVLQVP